MGKRYALFLLIAVGIVTLAELASIVTGFSPWNATAQVYWTFFLSLFCTLACWGTILWYAVKQRLNPSKSISLWVSLRQTSLISGLITLILLFNSLRILSIWDIIPLCLATVLIEFFFQAEKVPAHE